MKTITKIGSTMGIALTLSGCRTLYKIDVAAYAHADESLGNTYVILSADPKMRLQSPQFELHASQLERAMSKRGFERVSDEELNRAALGIYVSAYISDPAKIYHQVQTPVYTQGANEDLGSAAKNAAEAGGGSTGTARENMLPPAPLESWDGVEKAGFATTVYTKHLNLIAVDLQRYLKDIQSLGREEASPIEVWSVDVESTGQPDDLSVVIPILIAAAEPYIASETGDVIRVKLTETDRRVRSIKSGN